MRLRSEVAVYDYQAVASKFTAHDTQFNVVQGKINALVSESEITTLINGGKTLYSKLSDVEITVDGIRTQVSDVETQVFGDQVNSVKSRLSKVEQTAEGITTTVANVVTTPATVSSIVSKINQGADRISLSVVENGANLATNSYVNTVTGKKAQVIRSTTAPANNTENALKDGDVWVDTDDNNRVHVWNGTGKKWEPSDKKLDELVAWKNSAQIDLTKDSIYQTITSWNNGGQEIVSMINLDKSGAKINGDKIKIVANDSISLAISNGSIKPYYQASAPSSPKQGDIWYNTSSSNYKIYTYNNGSWVETEKDKVPKSGVIASINASSEGVTISGKKVNIDANDSFTITAGNASTALSTANTANTLAGKKNTVFRQDSKPTANKTGDVWVDTSNKGNIKVWNGSSWIAETPIAKINASSEGVTIDASKVNITAKSFRVQSTMLSWKCDFSSMTDEGKLTCTGADIAGKINASSGSIGGWTINTSSISGAVTSNGVTWTTSINKPSKPDTNVFKVSDGSTTPFRVTAQGKLYATGADISGKVSATSGNIAGWTISTDGLYKTVGSYEIRLRASTGSTDAAIRVRNTNTASNTFYVRNDGYLYASNADIKGNIKATSGSFAGSLSGATGTFKGSLSGATGTFKGSLSAATGSFSGAVTATSGQIGRFKISNYGFRWDYPENSTDSNWTHRMFVQGPRHDGRGGAKTADGTACFSTQKMINGKPTMVAWIYGNGDLGCSGKKTRVVKTSDGATRGLYAFESAVPYFMDCGKAKTGANGTLYENAGYVQITLNPTFLSATINKTGDAEYFVFVQPIHKSGNLYVTRMQESFRVIGTANCEFFWFAYIVQDGYANERMAVFDLTGQE